MVDLQDRYRGVLLGLACGDALGGPVEFLSREDIATQHPDGLRDFIGGGWLELFPGEITDDTQMTLAIARSLAERDDVDMEDIGRRFVAWADGDPKDIGLTTRAAIEALRRGIDWREAGTHVSGYASGNAAGNGAVMRCAPVALRFRTDKARLITASRDTARITHADRRCQSSAVAVNGMLAHLLDGGAIDDLPGVILPDIVDPEVVSALEKASDLPREKVRSGGFVIDTLQAALWSLKQTDSLEAAVVLAVSLGADTDTTGAVAGAFAGAAYGASAIPQRWLDQLQYRDDLTALADRLLERSQQTKRN
ncbi:MAG: ADP-ribosylglycohydrolase family protein [Thermomicrobiales bacterium]|nr:ADP-ribosylglycohydrolase family protein [Thermomicrobiales bacterium]